MVQPQTDCKRYFPALQSGFVYLDNAAGSQVPRHTIQAISDFLSTGSSNVGQLHPASKRASTVKERARLETAHFLGCDPGEVVFGQSATHLTFGLARAFSRLWGPGDEVVVSGLEHEANASPWRNLEKIGVRVKVWEARWPEGRLWLEDLRPLLSPQTRLVAITAASNLLGTLTDVKGAVEAAKSVGAWTVVDTVAYSPHHLPDVKGWGADFVFFSAYKVFGPHLAFLYVRRELIPELPTDKLWFIPDDSPLKFEPGTAQHELLAGWLGSLEYLREVLGGRIAGREGLERAYAWIEEIEGDLIQDALAGFEALPKVKLYGLPTAEGRTATFCFSVEGYRPREVEARLLEAGIGVSTGHCYATLPAQSLGIFPEASLRASLVHYNTREDLERFLGVLERL